MKKQVFLSVVIVLVLSCNEGKERETNVDTTNNRQPKPVLTSTDIQNPYVTVDVSPMDMTYYPVEYPKLKMANATTAPPLARVIYSRPHLQGRHVFNEVLKYGEPWRMGANESTELELFSLGYSTG